MAVTREKLAEKLEVVKKTEFLKTVKGFDAAVKTDLPLAVSE
jgi:hypothetical protein